jgi:acyl carrier protein
MKDMKTMKDVSESGLRDYLVERFGLARDALDDDTLLFSSGLLDSFSLVDVMALIEQRAGFAVSPGEVTLENFDSIARIAAYVRARTGEAP